MTMSIALVSYIKMNVDKVQNGGDTRGGCEEQKEDGDGNDVGR